MSNHSSDFDETMRARMHPQRDLSDLMKQRQEKQRQEMIDALHLGATGNHPNGQLTPQDEGGLKYSIGTKDGVVVIEFGSPVSWIGLQPAESMALAEVLVKHARAVSKEPLTLAI